MGQTPSLDLLSNTVNKAVKIKVTDGCRRFKPCKPCWSVCQTPQLGPLDIPCFVDDSVHVELECSHPILHLWCSRVRERKLLLLHWQLPVPSSQYRPQTGTWWCQTGKFWKLACSLASPQFWASGCWMFADTWFIIYILSSPRITLVLQRHNRWS